MAKGIRGKLSAFKVQVYQLLLLISVQINKLEDVLHKALNEKNAEAMEAEISAYIDRLKGATESLREFLTDNTERISREDILKERVDDLDFKDIDAWKKTLSDELIAKEISRHDVALDEMSKIKDVVTGLVERIKLFGGKVNYDMFLMHPGDDEYFGSRDPEMVDENTVAYDLWTINGDINQLLIPVNDSVEEIQKSILSINIDITSRLPHLRTLI